MDEQINEKLDALLKYVPFIDFIVEIDKEKYVKFIEIKKWIINKKRYPLSVLNKMEKSIITQYKNLIAIIDKKIPKEIMQIFADEFKHQYINLCSDDDEDSTKDIQIDSPKNSAVHKSDSEDDLEIVSILYPEKQKAVESISKSTQEREEPRTPPKESCGVVIDALDDVSAKLLRHIDQIPIEERKLANPHNYHGNSDEEEELFQRRNPNIFKRRKDDVNDRGNKNCKTSLHKLSTMVDTISLDSSDEETLYSESDNNDNVINIPSKNNSALVESDNMQKSNRESMDADERIFEDTLQKTDSLNINSVVTDIKSADVDCDHNDVSAKVITSTNSAIDIHFDEKSGTDLRDTPASTSIENRSSDNVSSDEVQDCTKSNDTKKNTNLENLLLKTIQKLLKSSTTEEATASRTTFASHGSQNVNLPQEIYPAPSATAPTLDQYQQRTPFYANSSLEQPHLYQHPSLHAYGCQNPTVTPFQVLANNRRLNLNDPRIRKELNKYKNSPLLSAVALDITANMGIYPRNINQPAANPQYCQTKSGHQTLPPNNRISHRPQNNSGTQNRMTYGEYKRRKAEEQQKAEIQQENERKRQQDSLRDQVYDNIENHDINKKTDEIRSILINTLQAYTSKIESMQEALKRPIHDTTNRKIDHIPPNCETLQNADVIDRRNGKENDVNTGIQENEKVNEVIAGDEHSYKTMKCQGKPKRSGKDLFVLPGEDQQHSTESNEGQEISGKSNEEKITNDKCCRALKVLDSSLNEYEPIQDCLSKTISGKRRTRSTDRSTKASQINSSQSSNQTPQSNIAKRRKTIDDLPKTSLISRRRSSVHARSEKLNFESAKQKIPSRRKSIGELPRDTVNHIDDLPKTSLISRRRSSVHDKSEKLNSESVKQTNPSRRKSIGELPTETVNHIVDADSELNDFEKFRVAKTQKLSEAFDLKQPSILVKRLTDDEIRKHTKCNKNINVNNNKSHNILNVYLVESKSQPDRDMMGKVPLASKKAKPKKLNNDCQMTESNTRFCALCSTRPSDLTNHYIRKHKSESYISRLTWSQLDDLSMNTPFAKVLPNTNSRVLRYSVICPFCDEELVEPFINLYNHYSTHTGEYAFQCSECLLEKPFKADIQSHQLHTKKCRGSNVRTMYRYPPNIMTIYLHYCTICNFVQLNEANILKHLRDHHDQRQATSNNVHKCILAAISNGPDVIKESQQSSCSNNDVHEQNQQSNKTENIDEMTELDMDIDDNIPVHNEACSEELSDLEQQLKEMHEEPVVQTSLPMTVVHFNPTNVTIGYAMSSSKFESGYDNSYFCKSEPIVSENKRSITPPEPSNFCKSEPIDSDDKRSTTPPRPSLQKLYKNRGSSKSTYRSYPPNVKYLGLYKCMADDCYYSTDSPKELLKHLEDHSSEIITDEYLACAYCSMLEGSCFSAQQLVDHISRQHLHMIYQCSMCCFRSCEASNVTVHQKESHPLTYRTATIYKCSGNERSYDANYVREQMAANVRKIQCTYCSHKSFYHSNLLEHHIKVDHKVDVQERLQNYSCIYCPLTNKDGGEIKKHVALNHPDELPYYCTHDNCVSSTEDILDNLETIDLTKAVPVIEVNATFDSVADNEPDAPLEEVKPNVDELLKLHEETVKVRLRKLTEKTGVAPDCLYHCPEQSCGGFFSNYDLWLRHMRVKHHCLECQCPHCPTQSARSLVGYKEHFEQHRRHTYICFHCSATFINYQNATSHSSSEHISLGPMRIEQIRFNFSYSYFVLIQAEMLSNRSELVPALLNNLGRSLKEVECNEFKNLKHSWLVSNKSASWLDDYTSDISSSTFFLCGACCSQYDSRQKLTKHINVEHVSRDVPIVNVIRRSCGTYLSLALVFANERLSFSTMSNCFCCGERDMKGDTFILHLKRYHKFVLNYFCEFCNSPIESLQTVKEHFKLFHALNKLKIRCELASMSDISVLSIRHFQVHIDGSKSDGHDFPLVAVKREIVDNDNHNDDSVILLEDDDVLLENYIRQQEMEDVTEKPTLRCIAIQNLLKEPTEKPLSLSSHSAQVVNSRDARLLPRTKFVQTRNPKSSLDGSVPTSNTVFTPAATSILNLCPRQQLLPTSSISVNLPTENAFTSNQRASVISGTRKPIAPTSNTECPVTTTAVREHRPFSQQIPTVEPSAQCNSLVNRENTSQSNYQTPPQQILTIGTTSLKTILHNQKNTIHNVQFMYGPTSIATSFLNSHVSGQNKAIGMLNSTQHTYMPFTMNEVAVPTASSTSNIYGDHLTRH